MFLLHVKFQLPSFLSIIVRAVGMVGRIGLVNSNVTFSLSLVLSSHPPDEPLCPVLTREHSPLWRWWPCPCRESNTAAGHSPDACPCLGVSRPAPCGVRVEPVELSGITRPGGDCVSDPFASDGASDGLVTVHITYPPSVWGAAGRSPFSLNTGRPQLVRTTAVRHKILWMVTSYFLNPDVSVRSQWMSQHLYIFFQWTWPNIY